MEERIARRKILTRNEVRKKEKKSCAKGKKVSSIPVNRENELEKDVER